MCEVHFEPSENWKATRRKLQLLEDRYNARHSELREAIVEGISQRSLKRTINQLKEEIVWCEAHLASSKAARESPVTRLRGIGIRKGRWAMIPELDDNGNLPPGIHRATLTEIEDRFGRSTEVRRAEMESLHWLFDLAKRAGIERLIVNGSFVTDVFEPNDVDCVVLMGPSFPRDLHAAEELDAGLPYIHLQIVYQERFDYLVNRFFATDVRGNRKGVIEVPL